jgi:acylphosphatase
MRLHVVVRGRVQGVGFRWFVREAARRLELSGWVTNRDDGGVEVVAQGAEFALEKFRRQLGRGPDGAVVASVEELEAETGDLPHPFAIVR